MPPREWLPLRRVAKIGAMTNQALQSGERVLSSNWQFAYGAQSHQVDGVVLNGVNKSETFVLNSRQRWVSWLLDGRAQVRCLTK